MEDHSWQQLHAHVVSDVSEWPNAPFLIVERRNHTRRGRPWCFLYSSRGIADPVVYMSDEWPVADESALLAMPRFAYENMHDVLFHGWTPYSVASSARDECLEVQLRDLAQ